MAVHIRVAPEVHVMSFVPSGSNCGRLEPEVIGWYCDQSDAYAVQHPNAAVSVCVAYR